MDTYLLARLTVIRLHRLSDRGLPEFLLVTSDILPFHG